MFCGERRNWRCNGSEEQADGSSLHCLLGPSVIQACAPAEGCAWVSGPTIIGVRADQSMAHVATGSHMDVCGLDHH